MRRDRPVQPRCRLKRVAAAADYLNSCADGRHAMRLTTARTSGSGRAAAAGLSARPRARVVVADAYRPTRLGVRAAVEPHGFEVVGDAENALEAVKLAHRERPDLCIIALGLPGGGLGAIREVAEGLPATRVVALGDGDSEEELIAAVAEGAIGYISRAVGFDDFVRGLIAALAGHAVVPAAALASVAERAGRERRRLPWDEGPRPSFTPRERQVLEALRRGASTADIARRLQLSEVTVRRYVSGLLQKTGAPSRAALQHILPPAGEQ